MGKDVFRFDSDRFASGDIAIVFSPEGFTLSDGEQLVFSENIQSIWYRRPRIFHTDLKDEKQRQYAENELMQFLEGLWLTKPDVLWMNPVRMLEPARKKILQLHLAARLKFLIPPFVVTNNPDTVRQFYRKHDGSIVFKAINQQVLVKYGNHLRHSAKTTLITDALLDKIELIRKCPAIFQVLVPKVAEIRLTVVGNQLFPVRIEPPTNRQKDSVDWRGQLSVDEDASRFSLIDFPNDLAQRCLALMKELGLVYGAFDFAVDAEGRCWFLELNANGQWYWIQKFTGLPIAKAIADFLANP